MAQDNRSRVAELIAAFSRGDMDTLLAGLDADIVWTGAKEFPDVHDYHGHNGVRAALADWGDVWHEMAFDVSEFADAGAAGVLASGHMRALAAQTDIEFEVPFFGLFSLREGTVTSVRFFLDADEARAAAGLA